MKKNSKISALLLLMFAISANIWGASIIDGKTYKITLPSVGGKVLSVKNSSLDRNAEVVGWTETGVNSQRWTVAKTSDGLFQLSNIYSDKNLYRNSTAIAGAKVKQFDRNELSAGKWELTPVDGQDGYFYITQMDKDGADRLYLEIVSDKDGVAVELQTKKTGTDAARQQWKIEETETLSNLLTSDMQKEMMQGFKAKYYKKAPTGYVLGNGGWWGDAEMFEAILDAYETTGNSEYETMFRELYKNFISRNRTDWSNNAYNDDIAWMVLASIRGYLMFGEASYLTYGKTNFDKMYARALLPSGMLRWSEDTNIGDPNGTNSCINGPAEVACCYLAIATGDETYYKKAKDLYALQRRYLYVPATGQVYDSFRWEDGKPTNYNYWASTYNQGTFLGAAVMLHNYYGDAQYKQDAETIMKYTKENLCDENGIISVCQVATSDLAGFKGILMRYVRRFVADMQKPETAEWLQKNALHAYNNRNSSGVTSSAWLTKTPENFLFQEWIDDCENNNGEDCENKNSINKDPFGPSTAVSAVFNAPISGRQILRDAFSKIEAEHFDYLKGLYVQTATDDDSSELGNVKNGYYSGYNNVNLGNNLATSIEIRVSKSQFRGSSIEVRLDSPQGELLATVAVPREGDDWQTVSQSITPIDGNRNIYLVCVGMDSQSDLFKINWFRFKSESYIFPDVTDNGGVVTTSFSGADLSNAIDNRLSTEFVSQGKNGWIQYESPVAVLVKGYALASAHDSAEKDPKAWKFQASSNGSDWTDLDVQQDQNFAARYQKRQYDVATTVAYRYFRLSVTDVNGGANLQFAEWQIYGSSIFAKDITADGGTLSAQYGGNESEETYVKLIDKTADSKYLVVDQSNLWVDYKANGVYLLSSYSLTSANDAPDRDPKDWSLYGSKDGKTWMLIDQQINQQFNYRGATQYYSSSAVEGYQYYRLHITQNNGASSTQLSELQLLGGFYFDRFYNDLTTNGGELTSSQDANVNSESLKVLTDKNGNSAYTLNASTLPAWIQYKSTIPAQLRAYSVTVGEDETKNPRNWTIEGSNDGQTWTSIHSRSNITFATRGERKTYTVSSSTKYQYFRMSVTKISSDASTEVKIGEWELHGTGISTEAIPSKDGTITSEYDGISAGESVSKLNDNSENSKYCTNFSSSAWVSYQLTSPAKITGYSITSANDNDVRDPKSWVLEASDDGSTWVVLDSRTDEVFPYRYTTQYYSCDAENKYTYFRLNITANNGAELLQAAEWQLLDIVGVGLDIEDIEDDVANIEIYPNPVTDKLYINMPDNGLVKLFSISGQLIESVLLERGTQTIDFNNYKDGIYLIQINQKNKTIIEKIIKR